MMNPSGFTNANVSEPIFHPSQVNTSHTGVMYQGGVTQGTQSQVYEPNQIYQGEPYQGTQGHDYYQRLGVPVPPQPAYPQYNGVSGGHNIVSLRESVIIQNSRNNASSVPGQPIPLSPDTSATKPSTSQLSNSSQAQGGKATGKFSMTKGQNNNNAGPSKQKGKEMEVADGNLTLELPAAGSTEEKPPDGGVVAWRIVIACSILNACSSTCLLILSLSATSMNNDLGEDKTESITIACKEIRLLAAPLVVIAIVKLNYRKVSVIGSIMVMVGFFVSGFLSSNESGLIGIFLGGVGGLGLACWYLCAIIPILEYFERRRLIALVLSNLGSVFSNIIIIIVYVKLLMAGSQMDWVVTLKYMSVPGAVGLAVSYFLQPLQLRMNDKTGQSFVKATLGVLDFKLFKDLTLYFVMLVYFFDQFGRGIPNNYILTMMTDKEFTIWEKFMQMFLVPVGMLIGYVLLIRWKRKGLIEVLLLWGPMNLFVGYMTLQIPAFDKFGWVAAYSVIFGITQAIVSSLLNNTVPSVFGVNNIRIVTALLGFSAGVGEIIASPAADDANSKYEGDNYAAAFYVAASMLLVAGACALFTRYLIIRKKTRESSSKANNTDENKTGGNDGESGENDKPDEHQEDNSDIGEILNKANEIIEEVDITDMEY